MISIMDDLRSRLLTMIASGASLDAVGLNDLIAEHADSNPQAKMLMQVLARRQQVESTAEGREEEDDDSSIIVEGIPRRERYSAHESWETKQMRAELDELRERNELMAAALGACHVCWGTDRDCPECRGRGRPGAGRPDMELFKQIVAPAVRRVRAEMNRIQRFSKGENKGGSE